MKPKILAVIPARFAAVRFPGKPLAEICGKPMIQWVYEAATECTSFHQTIVATDDERIEAAAELFGANVMMTRTDHRSGTERLCEVAEHHPEYDVFVNIQGDQPFVTPEILSRLVEPFQTDTPPEMATLACQLTESAKTNQNSVKVICDQFMNAIYFSRANIPFKRNDIQAPVYHHLGLYAFSRQFLHTLQGYQPTPLETCEQLEQLRALEHGHKIRVSLVDEAIVEVNTPRDLQIANELMSNRITSSKPA